MSFTTKPVTASNTAGAFLRLDDVLRRIPVSRATWYAGVKSGRYPAQVKLGPRAAVWRGSAIDRLAASFTSKGFA
ncbi:helix-turn-helix transcriptional regulator [Achromobacter mucicolens]|uniref:helix-turn-helix transcriptional regulator n=1 Tax=Achromobacter mucicolens TaxID=1389922 RepID=UPI0015D2118D|nr:AlpA family phage regulatory protein [Achromobacter mucicolens]